MVDNSTDNYTHVWRAYVQARVGFGPRPLDWTCVAGGPDQKIARDRAMAWIREANRHSNVRYWVTVKRYDDDPRSK